MVCGRGAGYIIDSLYLTPGKMKLRLYDLVPEIREDVDRIKTNIENEHLQVISRTENFKVWSNNKTIIKEKFEKKYTFKFIIVPFEGGAFYCWYNDLKVFEFLDEKYGEAWRQDYEKLKEGTFTD